MILLYPAVEVLKYKMNGTMTKLFKLFSYIRGHYAYNCMQFVPPCSPTIKKHLYVNNNITKTCLYNFDPLKPHFNIVKLGFTGVDIIFLIFAKKT